MYKRWKEILLLMLIVVVASFLFFYKLGSSYLENWDEGFYAQVTKEMIQTKDLFVLHWNHDIYLDKPPLNFWFNSFFSLLFGLTEFSVRITSALSGLMILIITTMYSYKNWGKLASIFTFITLAMNDLFIWRSRTGNLDTLLTLLILLSYIVIVGKNTRRYILLGILFGLIYLQKTTVVLFPISGFIAVEVFFNRKNLRLENILITALISLLISGGWLILGSLTATHPSFLSYYLFHSDQGVAHLDITRFKIDYFLFAYYSLQRRFFYLLVIGTFLLLIKIYKKIPFSLLFFAFFFLATLSFTERNNNWYLIPSMPFWSLIIGYSVWRLERFFSRWIPSFLFAVIILIPSFYISVKTFQGHILPIINQTPSVAEVTSALTIKKNSKPTDIIIRLDNSYPVTLYYSDRKTYFSDHIELLTYPILKEKHVKWVVGKKTVVDTFLSKFKDFRYQRINHGDESILKII